MAAAAITACNARVNILHDADDDDDNYADADSTGTTSSGDAWAGAVSTSRIRIAESDNLSALDYSPSESEEDTFTINQYTITDYIGNGKHGVIRKCHTQADPNTTLAMKILQRDDETARKYRMLRARAHQLPASRGSVPPVDRINDEEKAILKEIAIMKKCRHPHIVRLLEVIDDRQYASIYLVMEFCGGGQVEWNDGEGNPIVAVDQTKRIIRDVILGLEYLHYQGIIHRDIKPANLLYTANRAHVKIADFGVSHFSYALHLAEAGKRDPNFRPEPEDPILMNDADLTKFAGSPAFMAPEVVHDVNSPPLPITKAVDIWALGVTLFCLLFGRVPFSGEGTMAAFDAIREKDWEPEETMGSDRIPTGGRFPENDDSLGFIIMHLLDHCLAKDYKLRITLDEIKQSLWFLRDVPDPDKWLQVTGPAPIEVTVEEVSDVVSSVQNIVTPGGQRRDKPSYWNRFWKGFRSDRSEVPSDQATRVASKDQLQVKASNHSFRRRRSPRRAEPPSPPHQRRITRTLLRQTVDYIKAWRPRRTHHQDGQSGSVSPHEVGAPVRRALSTHPNESSYRGRMSEEALRVRGNPNRSSLFDARRVSSWAHPKELIQSPSNWTMEPGASVSSPPATLARRTKPSTEQGTSEWESEDEQPRGRGSDRLSYYYSDLSFADVPTADGEPEGPPESDTASSEDVSDENTSESDHGIVFAGKRR